MPQPQLFDAGVARDPYNGLSHPDRPLTPAPVGSLDSDETCHTCRHCVCHEAHGTPYRKCALMRKYWTLKLASCIRPGWFACRRWQAIETTDATQEKGSSSC